MSIIPSPFHTAGGTEDVPDYITAVTPPSGTTGRAEEINKLGGYFIAIESRIVADEGNAILLGSGAGGDLTGMWPNPSVTAINGIAITGTPTFGQVLVANSATTASWQTVVLVHSTTISKGTVLFGGAVNTTFTVAAPNATGTLSLTGITSTSSSTPGIATSSVTLGFGGVANVTTSGSFADTAAGSLAFAGMTSIMLRSVATGTATVALLGTSGALPIVHASASGTISMRGTASAGLAAYISSVLTDAPLGYWRLNETSGTVAYDSSGNGHSGSYIGTYALGATSPITNDSVARALNLTGAYNNGPSGYVSVPDTPSLNPMGTALTLECWVKAKTAGVAISTYSGFVWKQNSGGSAYWGLQADVNGVYPASQIYTSAKDGSNAASTAIDTGNWFHLVAVYNASTLTIYVNGVADTSSALTGMVLGVSGTPLTMGNILAGGNPGYQFNGYVCEVAVYGTALSSSRVSAHYAAATSTGAYQPNYTTTY